MVGGLVNIKTIIVDFWFRDNDQRRTLAGVVQWSLSQNVLNSSTT